MLAEGARASCLQRIGRKCNNQFHNESVNSPCEKIFRMEWAPRRGQRLLSPTTLMRAARGTNRPEGKLSLLLDVSDLPYCFLESNGRSHPLHNATDCHANGYSGRNTERPDLPHLESHYYHRQAGKESGSRLRPHYHPCGHTCCAYRPSCRCVDTANDPIAGKRPILWG